jgi:hypothetical protein
VAKIRAAEAEARANLLVSRRLLAVKLRRESPPVPEELAAVERSALAVSLTSLQPPGASKDEALGVPHFVLLMLLALPPLLLFLALLPDGVAFSFGPRLGATLQNGRVFFAASGFSLGLVVLFAFALGGPP